MMKYRREVMKIMSDYNFRLIRHKKHYVFSHESTNKKVIVSTSSRINKGRHSWKDTLVKTIEKTLTAPGVGQIDVWLRLFLIKCNQSNIIYGEIYDVKRNRNEYGRSYGVWWSNRP